MKIYYAGTTKPEERTCEVFGYPNKDNTGAAQYQNTHFLNIEDAWKRVIAEAEAAVEIEVKEVKYREARLQQSKDQLVKYTIEWQEAKDNYSRYEQSSIDLPAVQVSDTN